VAHSRAPATAPRAPAPHGFRRIRERLQQPRLADPASPEHPTVCGKPPTAPANQRLSRASSAARPNNAVTGSKPTDGSCGRDTFGDHCNEPAVVETLHRSAIQQDVRRLLQVARDSIIGCAVTRAQSPTHALIAHSLNSSVAARVLDLVGDLVYLEFGSISATATSITKSRACVIFAAADTTRAVPTMGATATSTPWTPSSVTPTSVTGSTFNP
jgi:hypothetical protein